MAVRVEHSTDPAEAETETGQLLRADPVAHNVLATLLHARQRAAVPIRCWWAVEGDEVLGMVFQSPEGFPGVVSVLADTAVAPLAQALAVAVPPVPGLTGLAHDASRLAGEVATATRKAMAPVEGQRIYEVVDLVAPTDVEGEARHATGDDVALLAGWLEAFHHETTGVGSDVQAEERVRDAVEGDRQWVWDVGGEPVACAVMSTVEAGVARVGFVYTPPEHRRRGHAAAITAAVSAEVLGAGHRCILYTQLSNPTSNAVYQRLGYRPVGEIVRYELV